jgi:L-lysine exporter family protein LysE/ArgO
MELIVEFPTFFSGMSLGLSLIIAIGAQNAFVLRQGLRVEHVFAVCLTCALSDALLIMLGVMGFGKLIAMMPWLDPLMRYGGAAFLVWYGGRSLWSAFHSKGGLVTEDGKEKTRLTKTLIACLAITWLNPHVYLDTVILLGSVSTQFAGHKATFAAGAITGSFLFFFALGYGAFWLRPVFARPISWRLLEVIIGAVMWLIALKLLFHI